MTGIVLVFVGIDKGMFQCEKVENQATTKRGLGLPRAQFQNSTLQMQPHNGVILEHIFCGIM